MALALTQLVRDYAELDFTRMALDSRVTFTRASTKTYFGADGLLRTAAINEWPLEYDPATGACLGRSAWVQRTNLCLWSRDLTNAAWVKTNITSAKDQTGIDGVANSASLLTAASASGTILQSIISASASRRTTAYVKRISGSGVIEMTQNGGATWTPVTVTASWTRVGPAAATITNPQIGFRIANSGDSIAVDYVQLETGLFPTPVIATDATAVTRGIENAIVAVPTSVKYNNSAMTFFGEVGFIIRPTGSTNSLISAIGSASSLIAYNNSTTTSGVFIFDGTNPAFNAELLTMVSTFRKFTTGFGAGQIFACHAGGSVATAAYNGRFSNPNSLLIGGSWNGYIKRLRFYPRRLSNAELQALTA